MRWTHRMWLCALLGLVAAGGAQALPPVGEPFPPFSARALGTLQPVRSRELVPEGDVTLLSFFTTWCKPCEREIPELLELTRRFGDRGFRVVLVSLDQAEAGEIREFLARTGSGALPAVWDEEGDLMALYGVFSLPTTILVDRGGLVAMAWQGYRPERLREVQHRLGEAGARP
ncbi:MAG TPA: TlpA disulfide reductase family protein [Deferrisomatales bacterium]|nr:TlpA disulfide reductase family protein [Deferrisomatales bacterium]